MVAGLVVAGLVVGTILPRVGTRTGGIPSLFFLILLVLFLGHDLHLFVVFGLGLLGEGVVGASSGSVGIGLW